MFGEMTYEFAPNWSVIVGGRLDHYKQDQTASSDTAASTFSSHSETEFIPKIGLTYDINAFNRVGLVLQEGYRPGGSGVRFDNGESYDYDAEKARNAELSWRGDLAGGRLTLGANVFYQDWDNQQVEIWQVPLDPGSSQIVNAGESESYGGELELTYQVSDTVNLYGGVGLLRTKFKDFVYNNVSLEGQSFSNAPEQSFVIGVNWTVPRGWFAGGNVKYTGSSLSRLEGAGQRAKLGSYTTVDAQVGYMWDQGLTLTAYATNLFDEEYLTYETSTANSLASLGARREVGLRLNKSF